jgi:hypothetical protein
MRPIKFTVLSVLALAAMPLISAPVMADDFSAIQFVPGTGADTGESASTAIAAPFADDASPRGDSAQEMNDMADTLANPRMQDGVANMIEKMTATMLRMPVGQIAAAVEKAAPGTVKKRIPSDATIADLAGRDARDLPENLGDKSRAMMGMASGFAKAFAVMLPEFEKMGKEMEASFKEAKLSNSK